MSQILIPEAIYGPIAECATHAGKSPDTLIKEILSTYANAFLVGQIIAYKRCDEIRKENQS